MGKNLWPSPGFGFLVCKIHKLRDILVTRSSTEMKTLCKVKEPWICEINPLSFCGIKVIWNNEEEKLWRASQEEPRQDAQEYFPFSEERQCLVSDPIGESQSSGASAALEQAFFQLEGRRPTPLQMKTPWEGPERMRTNGLFSVPYLAAQPWLEMIKCLLSGVGRVFYVTVQMGCGL